MDFEDFEDFMMYLSMEITRVLWLIFEVEVW
jgi:hypothetical protein